jgi:hypothetical protein
MDDTRCKGRAEQFEAACGDACCEHQIEFLCRTRDIEHQPAGMLPSEMMLFTSLCLDQGVSLVVESGRKFGYSTEILCCWLGRWAVKSVEREPQAVRDAELRQRYPAVHLAVGESANHVSRWVREAGCRVALLLDGPKGEPAYAIGDSLRKHLAFFAIHDVLLDSPLWGVTVGQTRFNTKDADWTRRWRLVDDAAVHKGGYSSREEMTAQGFGLAVFPGGLWTQKL